MDVKPILSIVTPTRGNFSEYWLEQLLKVRGSVEFVLVYPPDIPAKSLEDSRIKPLTSPYKGEMMQRFIGLLNASGEYVLALDDDDFVHPDVVELSTKYFQLFPQSWILRLRKLVVDISDQATLKKDWDTIPDVEQTDICQTYQQGNYTGLLEVPIAPLETPFNPQYLMTPFQKEGIYFENFNNIIWKNQIVQAALPDLSQATKLLGVLTWIPASGFDRLLGLFVQAKSFQQDAIIGHWMPQPEQIRYVDKPPELKPPRFHVLSDVLLVKYFPQYGYFWNLFFSKLYGVPRTVGKTIKWKLANK